MTIAKSAVILSLLACNSLAFEWQHILRATEELLHNKDAEDEDEMSQTTFIAQTTEWTQKYRLLIPYEHARLRAMGLGVSSKEEYDKLRSSHGPYLPSRPHEMYKEEWTSWAEFLVSMRSYEETQVIVQNELKLTSMEAYLKYVSDNPNRAEGLRIPARPDVYYKSAGWQNSNEFFAKSA
jgi:hypothetical protein